MLVEFRVIDFSVGQSRLAALDKGTCASTTHPQAASSIGVALLSHLFVAIDYRSVAHRESDLFGYHGRIMLR